MSRRDGLLPVFVDPPSGRILLALPRPDAQGLAGRYIYVSALQTGLGSAPVGLDRARLGDTEVVAFRQVGGRVIAEFENPRFRAVGASAAEQAAAREAF
ncbi:MAG: peptidase, partial [Pseudomonadota bacterium]